VSTFAEEQAREDAASIEESPLRRLAADFFESKLAAAGLVALLAVVFVALFATPTTSPRSTSSTAGSRRARPRPRVSSIGSAPTIKDGT